MHLLLSQIDFYEPKQNESGIMPNSFNDKLLFPQKNSSDCSTLYSAILSYVLYEHKGTTKQGTIGTISEKEKIMGTKNKK